MAKTFTVPLAGIIKETMLETIYMPAPPEEILVYSSDVNRPGLALSGYFDYFDNDRVQVGQKRIRLFGGFGPRNAGPPPGRAGVP